MAVAPTQEGRPPLITVSIVTFRTPVAMLQEALTSLRASALALDITIADNTPEAAYFASLQALPGVRCIKNSFNGGYGYGHNRAFEAAPPAPYHLILNPDVVVREGCLETLVEFLERAPDIGMAVPRIVFPDGRLQPLNRRDPTVLDLCLRRFAPGFVRRWGPVQRRMAYFTMMDCGYDASYDVPNASGCFMLLRRETFAATGGFDERFFMYFEDCDLTRRVRGLARVSYCPQAVIEHRWARGAHKSNALMLAMLASAWKYFQKWGWRWW